MVQFVILAGGCGTRLRGYSFPKPLNMIMGRPSIAYVLDSIPRNIPVHFIYNSMLEEYNFEEIIKNLDKERLITFFKLPYKTRGALESAYLGCPINNTDPIFFIDNDVILSYPLEILDNTRQPTDATIGYSIDTSNKSSYSFILINSSNNITKIVEKEKISDLFCCGVYGFRSADFFREIAKDILITRHTNKKEYYMSDAFVYLLEKNTIINATYFSDVKHVGSKEELTYHLPSISISRKRICFDLDNTLVTYPATPGDYSTVKPINKMIQIVRRLSEEGHTIIIHTARRMATHKNNVGAVVKDIGKVTFDTLDKFNIPYDELIFGKPIADIYIDDRAVNPYTQSIESMGIFTDGTSDDFILNKLTNNCHNMIKREGNILYKTGNRQQLIGEAFYYENIPISLKEYYPKYYGKIVYPLTIKIEYIEGIPLTYLWKERLVSKEHINMIFNYLDIIHSAKNEGLHQIRPEEIQDNYITKLKYRFEDSGNYPFSNVSDFQNRIITLLEKYSAGRKYKIAPIIHGDCWFANILLTYEKQLKFIDMRGRWGQTNTMSGDAMYDYAKLYQSILGYDFILFGYDGKPSDEIKEYFLECLLRRGICEEDLRVIMLSLVMGSFWAIADPLKERVWDWLTAQNWSFKTY